VSAAPISTTKPGGDSPVELAGGFPRHLTRELLEEDSRQGARLRRLAPWFLGAAYVLFALAFPLERVIGSFPMKAEASESAWWLLLDAFGGESLGFLLSALAAGLFLPLMTLALIAAGIPRGSSLVASVCVCLSPLMIHAATLPGPEAAAALLSLAAFWIITPHDAGLPRTSLAIAVGLAAASLDPGGLLILPALLTRHISRNTTLASSPQFGWRGFAWGVAAVVALELLCSLLLSDAPASRDSRVLRYAIFPGVLGLGLGLFFTAGLFQSRKAALAEYAPTWMRLWVVGGVISLLLPGASGACLAPVAAFAIADFLSRGLAISRSAATLLLAAQLTLTLGAVHHVRTRDPHSAWRLHFQDAAVEGDRLVSGDPAHRYLARIRWGFETSPATGPIDTLAPPYILDFGDQPPFVRRVVSPSQD
jgi:hypothetical protein